MAHFLWAAGVERQLSPATASGVPVGATLRGEMLVIWEPEAEIPLSRSFGSTISGFYPLPMGAGFRREDHSDGQGM